MDLSFPVLWRQENPDSPLPIPEYQFCDRKWRFDFAFPDGRVAVEFDGGQWQAGGGRHNQDPDRLKLNTAASLGWRVLRFSTGTWTNDPDGCMKLVQGALKYDERRSTEVRDLIELAEEAMGYTDSYFLQKWDMDERLQSLKARLIGGWAWREGGIF